MDEKYVKAFNAVVTFVNDLWEVFGEPKKASPLALYRRLIDHIKFTDVDAINKALCGFRQFLATNEEFILGDIERIPRGEVIPYGTSERVYLEIQKYIYMTRDDKDTQEAIRHHLVTISAILEPDQKKIEELERRMESMNLRETKEGEFISNIMNKAKGVMENTSVETPQQAIMGLLGSGVIPDMMSGLQQGVGSGEMDMRRLLTTMQSAIGAMIPQSPAASSSSQSLPAIQNIKDEEN